MWPKVWQVACTVDHVAEQGNCFEYRCGPYAVLIVRDPAAPSAGLRAFQNVYHHRGNSLCVNSGSGLRELKCGYHGWTWDLAGMLKRVPNRRGFGALRLSEFPLLPVRVDTWAGLVFVNLDADAMPLLHPELLRCVDDIHAPQQIWDHTGKSDQPYGVQSPRFEGALSDEEVWEAGRAA